MGGLLDIINENESEIDWNPFDEDPSETVNVILYDPISNFVGIPVNF